LEKEKKFFQGWKQRKKKGKKPPRERPTGGFMAFGLKTQKEHGQAFDVFFLGSAAFENLYRPVSKRF